MAEQNRRELTCHKCGYKWETESKMIYVTCPSCRVKTSGNQTKE